MNDELQLEALELLKAKKLDSVENIIDNMRITSSRCINLLITELKTIDAVIEVIETDIKLLEGEK